MIVLVGFMGAGKTTVGRLLAGRLGLPFVDTDALIEERTGAPVAEIFETKGELGFREIEREVVFEVLEGDRDAVVSLGGGAVVDPAACALLNRMHTIHLDVPLGEALRRVNDGGPRPMLARRDPSELLAERSKLYRSVAETTIDTAGRSPGEIADDIRAHLYARDQESAVRRVHIELGERSYDVVIGQGLTSELGSLVPRSRAEKAFVVTHPSLTVHAKAAVSSLESVGLDVHTLPMAEGEGAKTLASAAELYALLAAASAHRNDLLVAVGGGVVGDVGGFVASTYMRGMPFVQVPTTLLAQVDAAVGGKTAVNLPQGKNLVGTVYQPRAVIADVDLLKSCPADEIRSGMAEVIKYGLIADPDLLDYVIDRAADIKALRGDVLIEVVTRCVAIKASVVASDELDSGQRAFLNYGHTFAHAIESVTGFGELRHGEAVALGMMAAAHLAAELGRIDERAVELHARALDAFGLPRNARLELARLEEAWMRDKKYDGGVRFVLLRAIGEPEAGIEVQYSALKRALARLAGSEA